MIRPKQQRASHGVPLRVAAAVPAAPVGLRAASKIRREHLDRLAVVYVRQSSPQQVLENRESRERQYALAAYARQLGWAAERIVVIDEDQGLSGKSAENRAGFQRLMAEVSLNHVGIVLGLELSRLSRSNKDWHQLVDVCGIFNTLLCDQDGVYDASDGNDRLLLGMKGAMSEFELVTLGDGFECRVRLQDGTPDEAILSRDEANHIFGQQAEALGRLGLSICRATIARGELRRGLGGAWSMPSESASPAIRFTCAVGSITRT